MKQLPLRHSLLILLLVLFSISLFQCSYNKNTVATAQKLAVKEPFEKIKLAVGIHTIDAEKGGEIKLENGTKITVPANAFVGKDGKPVTGTVEIKYREFHTAEEIMVSGIPMKFSEGEKEYNFESAGMFDIRGFSGKNEVDIAGGKQLDIQLASNKAGQDFNFYVFDETEGRWKELSKNLLVAENNDKKEALAKLASLDVPETPVQPQPADPNATVINLDVNYGQYPQFKEFNGLLWQYAGTDPAKDPKNNPEVFASNWSNIDLKLADEKNSIFNLSIRTKDKTFTTQVKPVLSGKNLEKARQKFLVQQTEFKNVMEARARQEEVAQRQGDLMRSFSVSKFGIYNCDRFYNNNEIFAVEWDYKIDGPSDKSTQMVYHICKTDNTVVYYYPGTKEIKFNPESENYLVAVLPGDKIAIVDNEGFMDVKKKGVKKGGEYTFRFKTIDKTFTSVEQLTQLLSNI